MTQSSCKCDTKSKSYLGMKLAPVQVFSCKHPLSRCFPSVSKIQSTPLLSVKVVPVVLITKTTRDQSAVIYAKNFWSMILTLRDSHCVLGESRDV